MTRKGRSLSQSQLIICSICVALLGQSFAAPISTEQTQPQVEAVLSRARSDSSVPIVDIITQARVSEDEPIVQRLPAYDFSTGWIPGLYHQAPSAEDRSIEIARSEAPLTDVASSDTTDSSTHYPHKRQLLPVDDATYTLGRRLRQQRIFGIPITTSADWAHGRWAYDLEFGPGGMMNGYKRWVGMDHYRRCQFNEGCMRAALGLSKKVEGRD